MNHSELLALRGELASALARLDTLLAAGKQETDDDLRTMPHDTTAILAVLEREGKPMRPVQVEAALRAAGRNARHVQQTMFSLWQRGKIAKVAGMDGWYHAQGVEPPPTPGW